MPKAVVFEDGADTVAGERRGAIVRERIALDAEQAHRQSEPADHV
jgi:hypothetical protein